MKHDPHYFIIQVTKPDFPFSYATKYTFGFQITNDLEFKEEERENVSEVGVFLGREWL